MGEHSPRSSTLKMARKDEMSDLPHESQKKSRLRKLEKLILANGSVAITDLAEAMQVSVMTIHRDLSILERSGTVRRVRGAATALSSNLLESHIQYRASANTALKRKLGMAAAELVEPGHAVMIDDSTTAAQLFGPLSKVTPLTVISNSVALMGRFVEVPDIRFICRGGEHNARYGATVGLTTEQNIATFHPDIAFLSASAVKGNAIYHPDESIVRVKRAMIRAASLAVLVIDSTKFHTESLYQVCELTEFQLVLVDSDLDPELAADLRGSGVNLRIID